MTTGEDPDVTMKADSSTTAKEVRPPTLQGVSRAFGVLEALAANPMRPSELSEVLGISWATLHRTLAQLEADEFIQRNPAGVYHVGRKMWLLGSTYLVGHQLLELAVPLLSRAASDVPSAVLQLVERSGDDSVVLYSHEAATGEMITRTTYGHHFPLHCGSKGFVLLAGSPRTDIDDYLSRPLISLTAETMTDPAAIRERLDEVRATGHAVTVADVQSFTGSVSAPVFDSSGAVQACVCAVVRRSVLTGTQRETTVEVVLRLAQSLSLGLGWSPIAHARASKSQP